jgi:molybdate transport system substrate-binding protein
MFKMLRFSLLCLLVFDVSARAEAPTASAPAFTAQKTVLIFAAASLKNALDETAALFQKAHGAEIKSSYAASLTLAKQIEAGAPADIFISADVASMDYLAQKKLIKPETRVNLLGNRLVVIAPEASPLKSLAFTTEAFSSALGSGRMATGDPASVPVGKYAKAAFEKLGLWSALESRFAFTDNVRSALVFVAREEAPLGVVYATDAKSEPKVKIVATFAEGAHPKIVYPIAITQATAAGEAAGSFLEFLKGPAAKAVFEREGFIVSPR